MGRTFDCRHKLACINFNRQQLIVFGLVRTLLALYNTYIHNWTKWNTLFLQCFKTRHQICMSYFCKIFWRTAQSNMRIQLGIIPITTPRLVECKQPIRTSHNINRTHTHMALAVYVPGIRFLDDAESFVFVSHVRARARLYRLLTPMGVRACAGVYPVPGASVRIERKYWARFSKPFWQVIRAVNLRFITFHFTLLALHVNNKSYCRTVHNCLRHFTIR